MEIPEQKTVISDNNLIEIKDEVVVDRFRLSDLETQVELINGQIARIVATRDAEVAELEAEKATYQEKIATYSTLISQQNARENIKS